MLHHAVATRAIVFFLTCLVCSTSVQAEGKNPKKERPPTSVIAGFPMREMVSDNIEALGTLNANESVNITVHLAEIVSKIHFEEGQRVTKGEVLIEMENAEEQAQLREAKYTLEEARSQRDRIKAIAKRGDASQSLLDERQREYNVANARLAALQSRLDDRLVKAPFTGLVGLRHISPGAYLAPGDVITTLIDDAAMKLDFSVPSIYLAELEKGMAITAKTPAFADKPFAGNISSIDNRIDPVSRSVKVRAILPNPDGLLKPGLLMEVALKTNPRQTLTIPEEALVPKAREYFVAVITEQDGKTTASQVAVAIGSRWKGKVEILSGLSEDDRIVLEGADKIRPNSNIKILSSIRKPSQGAN